MVKKTLVASVVLGALSALPAVANAATDGGHEHRDAVVGPTDGA